MDMYNIKCSYCEKIFKSPWKDTKFCSRKCMGKDPKRIANARKLGKKNKGRRYRIKNRPNFKINPRGYKLLYKPEYKTSDSDGYIMEHRYIMEKFIGRYLSKSERVHHINGVRSDNRIENLRLCDSQQEHMSAHRDPVSGKFSPNLV